MSKAFEFLKEVPPRTLGFWFYEIRVIRVHPRRKGI
jgi:hypothetical protein